MPETSTPPPTNAPSSQQSKPVPPVSTPPTQDRTELLARARVFLNSPQILDQDAAIKRNFLSEKGLSEAEIERLLREPVRASCL